MAGCSVRGCENLPKNVLGKNIKFYTFPKNAKIASKWLEVCRKNINIFNARICSTHFASNCFKTEISHLKNFANYYPIMHSHDMIEDAIPTENLSNENVDLSACNEEIKLPADSTESTGLIMNKNQNDVFPPESTSEKLDENLVENTQITPMENNNFVQNSEGSSNFEKLFQRSDDERNRELTKNSAADNVISSSVLLDSLSTDLSNDSNEFETTVQETFKYKTSKELTTKLRSWRKNRHDCNLSNLSLTKPGIIDEPNNCKESTAKQNTEDNRESNTSQHFDHFDWEKCYNDFNPEQIIENCYPAFPEKFKDLKTATSRNSKYDGSVCNGSPDSTIIIDISDDSEKSENASKEENICQSISTSYTFNQEQNTSISYLHEKCLDSLYKKLRNQESRIKDLLEENTKLRKTVNQLQANQTKIAQDIVTNKVFEVLNELFTVDEIYILSDINERKRKILDSVNERPYKNIRVCNST